MSKFNIFRIPRAVGRSPITEQPVASGTTHEGAEGYARDAKSELFLLAVSNLIEDSYYEREEARTARYVELVRQVAVADGPWMLHFLRWLRTGANMRSAPLIAAAEAVKARLESGTSDQVRNRQLIDAVLHRADEPGELLAYWMSRHGRAIPKPVKRGVADAVRRLYTEYALLKHDTRSHAIRFGDVLELVHAKPGPDPAMLAVAPPQDMTDADRYAYLEKAVRRQAALFKHAIDRRHDRPFAVDRELLPMVAANAALRRAAATRPEVLRDPAVLRTAGMTWEDVLSLAGSRVDKRGLWEALIPSMGYMALLRNLRNFDEAGVSDEVVQQVAARLADPAQVARSRQFPLRFLAAHRSCVSLRWAYALEQALNASLANIPELPGRTLVLVDQSGSMSMALSKKSQMRFAEAAAIFGAAIAARNLGRVTLVQYGSDSEIVKVRRGESLLRILERFRPMGGTDTATAARKHYTGHDRVIIVTDEQAWPGQVNPGDVIPPHVPLYTFNLVGYRYGHQRPDPNRVTIGGGLTDAAFSLIPLLEQGRGGVWPWES